MCGVRERLGVIRVENRMRMYVHEGRVPVCKSFREVKRGRLSERIKLYIKFHAM